jgi:hypothetical protein
MNVWHFVFLDLEGIGKRIFLAFRIFHYFCKN